MQMIHLVDPITPHIFIYYYILYSLFLQSVYLRSKLLHFPVTVHTDMCHNLRLHDAEEHVNAGAIRAQQCAAGQVGAVCKHTDSYCWL